MEIAANLDDATGEVVGDALKRLLDAGALDAWATPIVMKKGRPGVTVQVLAAADDADVLTELLLEVTGSFGARFRDWGRVVLERRFETVNTEAGQVRVKVGSRLGRDITAKVEFDDASIAARQHGIPVREVIAQALAAWRQQAEAAPPRSLRLRREDDSTNGDLDD